MEQSSPKETPEKDPFKNKTENVKMEFDLEQSPQFYKEEYELLIKNMEKVRMENIRLRNENKELNSVNERGFGDVFKGKVTTALNHMKIDKSNEKISNMKTYILKQEATLKKEHGFQYDRTKSLLKRGMDVITFKNKLTQEKLANWMDKMDEKLTRTFAKTKKLGNITWNLTGGKLSSAVGKISSKLTGKIKKMKKAIDIRVTQEEVLGVQHFSYDPLSVDSLLLRGAHVGSSVIKRKIEKQMGVISDNLKEKQKNMSKNFDKLKEQLNEAADKAVESKIDKQQSKDNDLSM